MDESLNISYRPLTAELWNDFEELFGSRGACGGCWCMFWLLKRKQFDSQRGEENRKAMRTYVDSGQVPGIILYEGNKPVAWCAVAPRETYPSLERSRIMKRIDEKPVWSVVCVFIDRHYRKKGLSVKLLESAIDYVRSQGGKIVEGYPVQPGMQKMPDIFVWTGIAESFIRAGFREEARRSEKRPFMRYYIEQR